MSSVHCLLVSGVVSDKEYPHAKKWRDYFGPFDYPVCSELFLEKIINFQSILQKRLPLQSHTLKIYYFVEDKLLLDLIRSSSNIIFIKLHKTDAQEDVLSKEQKEFKEARRWVIIESEP